MSNRMNVEPCPFCGAIADSARFCGASASIIKHKTSCFFRKAYRQRFTALGFEEEFRLWNRRAFVTRKEKETYGK